MAKETSLVRQLQKLAVPQTTLLLQDKIKPSFLFDHRDAAGLDNDAIFAYGTNGLEKLQLMNPLFVIFEQNLFSINCKSFERSVQDRNVNAKLDEKLAEFLTMVSPYFLVRAAQEALEWLVYRYHIHLFNVDALIASVLPHYHSQTFVRVLQMLDLNNESSRWFWLLPVQKTGEPLEFNVLINRFICDGAFRKFVCDLAPNVLSVYKSDYNSTTLPIVSFSMLTVYFSLEKLDEISNNLVACLFPYITKALKSKFSHYKACAYLIISKIITKIKLSTPVIDNLLSIIFESLQTDLLNEGLEVILLLFQQQDVISISRNKISALWSMENIVKFLRCLVDNYHCSDLLQMIIKKSITVFYKRKATTPSKKNMKSFKFMKRILNTLPLDEKSVVICLKTILKQYSKYYKSQKHVDSKNYFKKCTKLLLRILERQYPKYFDNAIENFFKIKANIKDKLLYRLVNDSVCSVRHKVMRTSKTTLLIGVNHINWTIRQNSVKSLLEEVTKKTNVDDPEFVKMTLVERLNDDYPGVVNEVLSAPKILSQFLTNKELVLGIKSILEKDVMESSAWYPLQMKSLNILCDLTVLNDETLSLSMFLALLPFLFPLQHQSLAGFQLILNSPLGKTHCIIHHLKNYTEDAVKAAEENDESKLLDLNCIIFSVLQNHILGFEKVTFLRNVEDEINKQAKKGSLSLIYIFTLEHIITSESNAMQRANWIKICLSFFKSLLSQAHLDIDEFKGDMKQDCALRRGVESLVKNKFSSSIIFFVLCKICRNFKLENSFFENKWWPNNSDSDLGVDFESLVHIMEFLIVQLNSEKKIVTHFRNMFSVFIGSQFSDIRELFLFMSSLWSTCGNKSVMLQVASLNISNAFCNEPNSLEWFFDSKFQTFPALLDAISSSEDKVRCAGINLLSSILLCCENCEHEFKVLGQVLCMHSEEIVMDFRQCSLIVRNWLKPAHAMLDDILLATSPVPGDNCPVIVLKHFLHLMFEKSTPCHIRYNILLFLKDVDSAVMLSSVISVLDYYLAQYKQTKHYPEKVTLDIIQLLLNKFSKISVVSFTDTSKELNFFLQCLQLTVTRTNIVDTTVQIMTLRLITKEFFSAIPTIAVQHKILKILVDMFINAMSSDINAIVGKTLRKLCTSAHLLLKIFQETELSSPKKTSLKEVKQTQCQGKYLSVELDMYDKGPWKRLTVILEIIQNKTKIGDRELLIPELFLLLNKTLNVESQPSVDYLRQLILSCIFNCCQELGIGGLDERQFQVELIVHCIRSSANPKTHHQSLLLLNLAATMFPEYVLSNVMSIFTFMGSNLVRQDDSYSFQVISQTIETIVPSLLEASSLQQDGNAVQVVSAVIRVFVDSLADIPRHRQLPLFTKLVSTLDPSKYLWIPLCQICDQYATMFHDVSSENHNNWEVSPTLEFAVNLHKQFSPSIQIDTCVNLMKFVITLPDTKQQNESNVKGAYTFKELFDVANRSDKQLQIFKQNVLSYMNIWLSSPAFVIQVSELDNKGQSNLEEKYKALLEVMINYLHQLNLDPHILLSLTDENSLLNLLYNLINHVNSLLPCNLFIKVVKGLLCNTMPVIQQKAIEMLNAKLKHQLQGFFQDNFNGLLKLLRPLLKIIKINDAENLIDETEDTVLNKQTALFSLHLLTKTIGSKYPEKFYKVLIMTMKILSAKENKSELIVNALLCLAQLCTCLNTNILPHLNSFMPQIIHLLENSVTVNADNCLTLAVITALQSLIENMGEFMSNYMEAIVTNICILSVRFHEEKSKSIIEQKLKILRINLAKNIAIRVLLPAVEKSYPRLLQKNEKAVCPLIEILSEKVATIDSADVKAYLSRFQKFYLILLDFRSLQFSQNSLKTVDSIEGDIISSLTTFVLKLSESQFRIFFQSIYLWASSSEKQNHKILTFYRLTFELSKSLKKIFVLFAKYFIRHAASILDSNNTQTILQSNYLGNEDDIMTSQLLNFIIDTLKFCFQYDEGHLLDIDCFNVLMKPLVNQIGNLQGDDRVFRERVENHLSCCIAHFISAVSDNVLWKSLNYEIMLKTRHSSAKVRFGSLQVIREIVKKMGDNYLVLLPESIPFLAEMMEDDSFEVEQECQSIVMDMEKILGEPLRKYF